VGGQHSLKESGASNVEWEDCARAVFAEEGAAINESCGLDLFDDLFQAIGAHVQGSEQYPAFACDRTCSVGLLLCLGIGFLQNCLHVSQLLELSNQPGLNLIPLFALTMLKGCRFHT
jgi:hypothetical protein